MLGIGITTNTSGEARARSNSMMLILRFCKFAALICPFHMFSHM